MVNLIAWIVFGALAGWIASLVMNTDEQQGGIANIVVGILGAVIGGFIVRALGSSGMTGFNLYSLLVAIGGAIVLLGIFKTVAHR